MVYSGGATAAHFFVVTPRLFATAGFLATRDNHGRLRLPSMVIPRSSPSSLLTTARTLLRCHASRPSVYARSVMPHNPPLSLGFLATQGKSGRAAPALGFALRSSPSEGRRGSDASALPSDSGQIRSGCARLTWLFLASVQPGCSGGCALLCCHASPVRDGWLRSDSEQNRVATPPWVLFLASLHPACSRRLGRFYLRNITRSLWNIRVSTHTPSAV